MCDPVSIGIGALSAVTSLAGTVMASKASQASANAITEQNRATTAAQNAGFYSRNAASVAQTTAQTQAQEQTLSDRAASSAQTYQAEQDAINARNRVLTNENTQADQIRAAADAQAQTLLDQTNQAKLNQAQTGSQTQAAALLAQTTPQGPGPTDPTGGTDTVTQGAVARRLAEASSNVRDYGAKVAAVQSYAKPLSDIGEAIAANKVGIMPQQQAYSLLSSGSNIRLLPYETAYTGAQSLGSSMDDIIKARGQSALDTASLVYNDATANANLEQSDATTIAANTAAQAKANAAYDQSVGNTISGLGNLGLYGAGYLSSGGKIFGYGTK
jgi:actin-related protein